MTSRRVILGAALAASVLSGCGFKLRGQATLPATMSSTYIDAPRTARELVTQLGRLFAGNGVTIAEAPGAGIATLVVEDERLERRVQSVGATARVREFALVYRVRFRVDDDAGELLVAARDLEIIRDYSFDQNQVLGTTSEEELRARELRREMASRILASLSAS